MKRHVINTRDNNNEVNFHTSAHLQSLILNQADNAVIEMKYPEHFGWKFDETRYIAIVKTIV